jgi:hypothetical protein
VKLLDHAHVRAHLFRSCVTLGHLVESVAKALRALIPTPTTVVDVGVVEGEPTDAGEPTVSLVVLN